MVCFHRADLVRVFTVQISYVFYYYLHHAGLVRGLVAGVVASRTGLWIFDLAVTQLVQERVDKKQIGIVSGLQSSLSACFETLSFLAGIYFADPELFYWLMLGSLGLVSTAFTFYAMFAIKQSCFPGRTGSTGAQAV